MRDLAVLGALTGVILLSVPIAALASPDSSGRCGGHLQRLGYTRVKLDAASAKSSLYEAWRGREEVKLMVDDSNCAVQQVWLDD